MRLGITGHRGLPEKTEQLVREALAELVREYEPGKLTGVSCLAEGPDTWFAEAVLEHGGKIEAVVPSRTYREALPDHHVPTYDRLLGQAVKVYDTGLSESNPTADMLANENLVGLVDELLAVWDGRPARAYGGAADVVAHAERQEVRVRRVWPEGSTRT
ncbi:hypothetical protein [Streptomyces sp. ODS28]|uniref:hypothetical protein n=1 Tax=Streptomyces sp. ODS28 TaxID=3136688 RepID=UPI0031EA8EA7